MHRLFALLSLLALSGLASAQPLLTPTELSARLSEPRLRIVDIRAARAPDGAPDGAPTFDNGHIAGAVSAPYAKWRGPKDNPGRVPEASALTVLIRSLGIDAETPVVVVHQGTDATEFGAAARVVWTLKAAGLTRLSILNGGMKAWRAAGLPVTTEVAAVAPSNYTVRLDPDLIATQQQVADVIGRQSVRLLDARPSSYFLGETRHVAARSPGTLVGAKNVEYDIWFVGDSPLLQSPEEIRRIAAREGIDTDQPTVSFCNTGHWAATNWFVLSEVLGQKDVRLYPESMVGWSAAGLPMDNVPSRLVQFWLQLKEATGTL